MVLLALPCSMLQVEHAYAATARGTISYVQGYTGQVTGTALPPRAMACEQRSEETKHKPACMTLRTAYNANF